MAQDPSGLSSEPVGLIGLGLMGAALAHRLLGAGYNVLGYDIDPGKALLVPDIEVAGSIDDICLRCSRVVIAVGTTRQVEAVVAELETTAHPMLVLCTTTVYPRRIAFAAARAARYGITLVEAPISGTSLQVESGKGIGLVAGPIEAVEQARPLLDALCPQRHALGSLGDAAKASLALNLVQQLNNAAIAEGLVFAERLGLAPADFLAALRGTTAGSQATAVKAEKMVRREYSPQSPAAQALKDAQFMIETAHRLGQNLPMMEVNAALLAAAIARRGGQIDSAAVIEAIRASRPK